MKTLLIITGPQGSGNHLWAKVFALHPAVHGWSDLLHEYWIGHDQEPFAHCWKDPDQLKHFDWSTADFFVTGVSAPYMHNGQRVMPNIVKFAATAMGQGIQVKIAILGRDRNILNYQETRVRGEATFEAALQQYKKLATWSPVFLSYELLHLYGVDYLRQVSQQLKFPIDIENPRLHDILIDDTNKKYLQQSEPILTDQLARRASGLD